MAQAPGCLVFLLSISAVQWLCNADKKSHSPPKRLYRFFSTLYTALVSVMLCQSSLVHVSSLSNCCSEVEEHPVPTPSPAAWCPALLGSCWSPAPGRAAEELPLQPEQQSWGFSGGFGAVGTHVWAGN